MEGMRRALIIATILALLSILWFTRGDGTATDPVGPATAPATAPGVTVTTPPTDDTLFANHNAAVAPGIDQWRFLLGTDITPDDLADLISDPASSDLDLETWEETGDVAAGVVTADLTGEGRDRWPDYWEVDNDLPSNDLPSNDPGGARPAYQDVRILAVGSAAGPADGVVAVMVLWSATPTDPLAAPPAGIPNHVILLRADDAGGWEPIHPWELDNA